VRHCLLPLALLIGCAGEEPWDPPAGWSADEPIACDAPTTGWDRFTESSAAWGLDEPVSTLDPNQAAVAADDLDGDGDVDLLYTVGELAEWAVFLNEGGTFEHVQTLTSPTPPFGALGLADRDGDGLPEAWLANAGGLWLFPNEGGTFGDHDRIFTQPPDDWYRLQTFSIGDADGDGDLDAAWLQAEHVSDLPQPGDPPQTSWDGTDDRILLLDGDDVVDEIPLTSPEGTLVLVGNFTDRDGDGDQDLLIPSDRDLMLNFWRNDGGAFTEDAEAVGADLRIEGMGLDTADLNEDGQLDYCITDTGPPVCLVSSPDGYIDEALARGLNPAAPGVSNATVGWSMELLDFDDDGWLDFAHAAGPQGGGVGSDEDFSDLFWAGAEGGTFVDVSAEAGLDDFTAHYGTTAADFDGDGSLDFVTVGHGRPPRAYANRCGGGWLELVLDGLPGNHQGFGARATVRFDGRRLTQELQGIRGQGQRPSWFRFGVGEAERVDVEIVWPDGAVSEAEGVPVRRRVTVSHPER
jgi:hypothetical protein